MEFYWICVSACRLKWIDRAPAKPATIHYHVKLLWSNQAVCLDVLCRMLTVPFDAFDFEEFHQKTKSQRGYTWLWQPVHWKIRQKRLHLRWLHEELIWLCSCVWCVHALLPTIWMCRQTRWQAPICMSTTGGSLGNNLSSNQLHAMA